MRIAVTGASGFIGTNFIEEAVARGHAVENYDVLPPRNSRQSGYWRETSILDREAFAKRLRAFSPDVVVHLAAQTDLVENRGLTYYAANTDGVANVVEAISRTSSVKRAVFASTMLVCRYGYTPAGADEYCPNTLYGESKVIGEGHVRKSGLSCTWTMIRPTSIWGPWCEEPYKRFLQAVVRGRYFHPGTADTSKALGFVGNTVHQIFSLIDSPNSAVHGKTFYLFDYPGSTIREWANIVQRLSGARPIRSLPLWALRCAAVGGDLLKHTVWNNPPMSSFRLRNMLTSSSFDAAELQAIAGRLPYTVEEGVRKTLHWLLPEMNGGAAGRENEREAAVTQGGWR